MIARQCANADEIGVSTMTTEVRPLEWSPQIDRTNADIFIAEKRIGERIKRLRAQHSMGLAELGRRTGLSTGFLSQLQTGRVVPTLRNLALVAMVFSKDLSYFFETEPQTFLRIHRKSKRVRLPQTGVDDPTYYFESLGYMVPDRPVDPYYAEFLPTRKVDVRPHVHSGYEFLYLLEGELEIRHADKAHVLGPGDGVYFDASTTHSYRCLSKTSAISVIVTMHQQRPSQSPMGLRPLDSLVESRTILAGTPAVIAFPAPGEPKHQTRAEGSSPLKKYQHLSPSHEVAGESLPT